MCSAPLFTQPKGLSDRFECFCCFPLYRSQHIGNLGVASNPQRFALGLNGFNCSFLRREVTILICCEFVQLVLQPCDRVWLNQIRIPWKHISLEFGPRIARLRPEQSVRVSYWIAKKTEPSLEVL